MARTKGTLTALQRKFVAEYLRSPTSATKAAIRAGVPPSNARHQASAWRNDPAFRHVQDAIDMALSDDLVDAKRTRRVCWLHLMQIVEGVLPLDKLREIVSDPSRRIEEELEPEELALIAGMTLSKFQDEGVTVTAKPWHKLQAINLLMKFFATEDGTENEDEREAAAFDRKLDAIEKRLEDDAAAELAELEAGAAEPE